MVMHYLNQKINYLGISSVEYIAVSDMLFVAYNASLHTYSTHRRTVDTYSTYSTYITLHNITLH